MVTETQEEMELLVYELRSVVMEKGFYEALENLCGLFRSRYKLAISVCFKGAEEDLKIKAQTALYRVAQEALNNVVKHAQVKSVKVEMEISPQGKGVLRIRDDGRGFDESEIAGNRQYGLQGMKERVTEIGGELTIESAKGKGTTVTVSF